MNIPGSVAREREQVLAREVETDCLIIPKTRNAKAKQSERERGEENKSEQNARGEFETHGSLFARFEFEHQLARERFKERDEFFGS